MLVLVVQNTRLKTINRTVLYEAKSDCLLCMCTRAYNACEWPVLQIVLASLVTKVKKKNKLKKVQHMVTRTALE